MDLTPDDAIDAARFRWVLARNPGLIAGIAWSVRAATFYADPAEAVDVARNAEPRVGGQPTNAFPKSLTPGASMATDYTVQNLADPQALEAIQKNADTGATAAQAMTKLSAWSDKPSPEEFYTRVVEARAGLANNTYANSKAVKIYAKEMLEEFRALFPQAQG